MKVSWLERATKIPDKQNHEPNFKDFAMFVKEKARMFSNPHYESLLTKKTAKCLTVLCAQQLSPQNFISLNTSQMFTQVQS